MAQHPGLPEQNGSAQFSLRFETPGNYVPVPAFLAVQGSLVQAVEAIGRGYFGDEIVLEVRLLPFESGSFRTRIAVVVVAVGATTFAFLESKNGIAIVEVLTGQKPVDWIKHFGKEMGLPNSSTNLHDPDVHTVEVVRKLCAHVTVEVTASFLSSSHKKQGELQVDVSRFRNAFHAKNEFYGACENIDQLRGIEFENIGGEYIRSNEFRQHMSPEPIYHGRSWRVNLIDVAVVSPNWDPNDKRHKWKALDSKGQSLSFVIEDPSFWELVRNDKLQVGCRDHMQAQMLTFEKNRQVDPRHRSRITSNHAVPRVLQYNKTMISSPMSDDEVEKYALRSFP